MAENDTGIKCPKCGKKIIDDGTTYRCESSDFKCWKKICGTEITLEELHKILAGQGDKLEFTSNKNGKPFTTRMVLNEAKDGIIFEFAARKKDDHVLKCPKCGQEIIDDGMNYKCKGGDFKCLKNICCTEISREELRKILAGQGDKLKFTSRTGKPFTSSMVLNEAKDDIVFDFVNRKKGETGVKSPDGGSNGPTNTHTGGSKTISGQIIAGQREKHPILSQLLSKHPIILCSVLVLIMLFLVLDWIRDRFFPDMLNMEKSRPQSFEITLSNRKSAQKLEEFLDKNAGKIVELTLHYKQNLVYGWGPRTKYTEDSYYGDKYDSREWDSAEPAYDVTYSSFGDNNRFYVRSFLYDKNQFEVEYRDFGGIGYCDFTNRYAYQLMIPYVKNNERMFEWQRDREKSREYIGAPSPYWVLKGTFIVNVKNGEELTDNISTLYDEFQKKKLKADYGKEYVVPEIANILAVKPDCGDRKANGDYSFSGKSFELEPLTQREHRQMDYN